MKSRTRAFGAAALAATLAAAAVFHWLHRETIGVPEAVASDARGDAGARSESSSSVAPSPGAERTPTIDSGAESAPRPTRLRVEVRGLPASLLPWLPMSVVLATGTALEMCLVPSPGGVAEAWFELPAEVRGPVVVVVGPGNVLAANVAVTVLPHESAQVSLRAGQDHHVAVALVGPLRLRLPRRPGNRGGGIVVAAESGVMHRADVGVEGGVEIYGLRGGSCRVRYPNVWPSTSIVELVDVQGRPDVDATRADEQVLRLPAGCCEPRFVRGRETLWLDYDITVPGQEPGNLRPCPMVFVPAIPASVRSLSFHCTAGHVSVDWRDALRSDGTMEVYLSDLGSLRVLGGKNAGWRFAAVAVNEPWPAWPESGLVAVPDGEGCVFGALVPGTYRLMAFHRTEGSYFHEPTVVVAPNEEARVTIEPSIVPITVRPSRPWGTDPSEVAPETIGWNGRYAKFDPRVGAAILRVGGLAAGAVVDMELAYGSRLAGYRVVRVTIGRVGERLEGVFVAPSEPSARLRVVLPWRDAVPVVTYLRKVAGWNGLVPTVIDERDGAYGVVSDASFHDGQVIAQGRVDGKLVFAGWVERAWMLGDREAAFEGRWSRFVTASGEWSIGFAPDELVRSQGATVHWARIEPCDRFWLPSQCAEVLLHGPDGKTRTIAASAVGEELRL
jgi:hypothetical protein